MARRYGLGRRPDPGHARALARHPITARVGFGTTDRTSRYWPMRRARLDQGPTGECVGHALAHRYANAPVPHDGIDHAWAEKLYLDATYVDIWPDNDGDREAGTSGLAACKVLLDRGQISAFHWIGTPSDFMVALFELGPICIGIPWLDSMFDPVEQSGNQYLRVDRSSPVAGGHELCVTGGNEEPDAGPPFARVLNSWGLGWGFNGTARIPLEDLWWLIFERDGDAVLIDEVE